MKTISRYIMTLALLLTAVTGAWAQTPGVKPLTVPNEWNGNQSENLYINHLPKDFVATTEERAEALSCPHPDPDVETVILIYGFDESDFMTVVEFRYGEYYEDYGIQYTLGDMFNTSQNGIKWYYTTEPSIDITPVTGQQNQWTFTMPDADVELTPIYAKAAAFATTGTEPEATTLLPEAAEGVIAGTDASLIAEGTGIVAFAGTSTTVTQGTLMYAIGTSATTAPALTAFSATVPTAEDVDEDGADVYVWYYIKGADAPEGVAATLDNTFDNTDPACLTVTVRSNKFDLTLKAANANTIEAGKATVTVGGTAATVTEGKLQGVKMGSEVKLEAKPGYKFRKVEVKKKVITMLNAATTENIGMVVCNAGHLHDAKTAVPAGCTAVGILGKVTETGHGLILALKNATNQTWNTINGWASASYAGTTLKVLPDDGARSTNLSSYTTLGETTVSNWAVAQKSDYAEIFTNLGSKKNSGGMTYDNNVNAYITTDVGGTAMSGTYWSATQDDDYDAWYFHASSWYDDYNTSTYYVRPVLGF